MSVACVHRTTPGAADDCAKQNSSKKYSGVNLSVVRRLQPISEGNSPSPRTLSSRPQEIHMTINRLAILTRRCSACAQAILVASALSLWSIPVLAQTPPERLSDKQVKTLIDQVDEGRDKFEGNLDGKFKGSTLRGPSGETKVEGTLQDYQDNTKKLQSRFASDYS